jgi:hypothetical protein
MPESVKAHIAALKAQGAKIYYHVDAQQLASAATPESMKTQYGLKAIRRRSPNSGNAGTGYHYFIANLTPNDIDADVPLAVPFQSATLFNPLNGDITPATVTNGKVHLALRSGQSIILQTKGERQKKLKILMEVMTYLKSIEQLKEKRLREYNEQVMFEEQKFLDELGLQLTMRARREAAS